MPRRAAPFALALPIEPAADGRSPPSSKSRCFLCAGLPAAPLMAPKKRPFGSAAADRAARADALQAARAAAAAPPAAARCNLASSLLELWAWGSMSAAGLQKLAKASADDGSPSAATAALARIGCGGTQPSHCQRDMLRLLRKHLPPQPRLASVIVPLAGGKDDEAARLVTQPYLPLRRVFAHSFLHYPDQFTKTWGTQAGAAAFWAGLRDDDPNAAEWRAALASKDLSAVFPYAVHGDGVPVFKHKSLECWSAGSLLAEGSVKDVKTLTFCYWHTFGPSPTRTGWTPRTPCGRSPSGIWRPFSKGSTRAETGSNSPGALAMPRQPWRARRWQAACAACRGS